MYLRLKKIDFGSLTEILKILYLLCINVLVFIFLSFSFARFYMYPFNLELYVLMVPVQSLLVNDIHSRKMRKIKETLKGYLEKVFKKL